MDVLGTSRPDGRRAVADRRRRPPACDASGAAVHHLTRSPAASTTGSVVTVDGGCSVF